jgi:putative hydrolase of the HAD superfamily
MKKNTFVLFDCMETLIDLRKLPNLSDYAAWGFYGSGAEELWEDFDAYFRNYLLAKAELSARLPEFADYEMKGRFFQTVRSSFPDMDFGKAEEAAEKLYVNYWRNYKALSYVREDVREVVPELANSFRLGVVSNFMVMGGIEEMLELHGLIGNFEFVVTSIAEGWRKPHPAIYRRALDSMDAFDGDILFVGDDYVNDFVTPGTLDMKPIFLDRYERHPELADRVTDFYQLREKLLGK